MEAGAGPRQASPVSRLGHRVLDRVQDPSFWVIQISVTIVTVLHVGVEVNSPTHDESPWTAVTHLPIMLYLIPVVYAGMRYGFEGSLLTGVSVALIAAPNLFLWHHRAYEWLGELLSMAFVVAAGVAISVPVERERTYRARAERARAQAVTASRRLALLNDVISTLVRSADIHTAVDVVLRRLVEVLELDGAGIVTWRRDGPSHSIELRQVVDDRDDGALEAALGAAATGGAADPHVVLLRFQAGDECDGAVLLRPRDRRPIRAEERELLHGIATQVGVAIDNARMHAAEREALEQYLRAITRVQEEERRRIARELHDVATHELLLLRRDLDGLQAGEGAAPGWPDATSMRRRIDDVTSCLRRFGRQLRPSVLDHLGLEAALGWLASQADERATASVRVGCAGEPRRLDAEVELALYRIAEEALRNAERHAAAASILVSVTFGPGEVSVGIEDDGRGFEVSSNPGALGSREGLGLIGMQERAALVGAELSIASTPGRGTRVVMIVNDGNRAEGPGPTPPEGPGVENKHGQPSRREGAA